MTHDAVFAINIGVLEPSFLYSSQLVHIGPCVHNKELSAEHHVTTGFLPVKAGHSLLAVYKFSL